MTLIALKIRHVKAWSQSLTILLILVLGILQAFAALGPAVDYIFGGLFLKIYVDVDKNIDRLVPFQEGENCSLTIFFLLNLSHNNRSLT